MKNPDSRLKREQKTLEAMIKIYCESKHRLPNGQLCEDCGRVLGYAAGKTAACPLKDTKTTCKRCHVHCYSPDMREKVREIMRHSGPKMALRHPVLSFFHVLDSLKSPKR